MSQEYRIPDGLHNQGAQASFVRDEIDQIFQNQPVEPIKSSPEIQPVIGRLLQIGDIIANHRAYRLDTQFFHKNESRAGFTKSVSRFLFGRDISPIRLQSLTEEHLRIQESNVAASLFAPRRLPDGLVENLSLFNYDRNNWYFHQVVTDTGARTTSEVTLHYEVHPQGVLFISSKPEVDNRFIVGEELASFVQATEAYHQKVSTEIYSASTNVYSIGQPPIQSTDETQRAA